MYRQTSNNRHITSGCFFVVMAIALLGCGSGSGIKSSSSDSVVSALGAKLPDDFPANVPLPKTMKSIGWSKKDELFIAAFVDKRVTLTDLSNWFQQQMPQNGWKPAKHSLEHRFTHGFVTLNFTSGKRRCQVTILNDDDAQPLKITLMVPSKNWVAKPPKPRPKSPTQLAAESATKIATVKEIRGMLKPDQLAVGEPIVNSIGMILVPIPAGQFLMGSPMSERGRGTGETQHQVTISKAFYIGAFEVTQGQYKQVMGRHRSRFRTSRGKTRRSTTADTSNFPADSVGYRSAGQFCTKLSKLPEEQAAGRRYRLPAEAQWEYVCRAGTTTAYSFGNDKSKLVDYGWFASSSNKTTHPVGQKQPNPWGLFDTHGNVWEWCSDRFGPYPRQAAIGRGGPGGRRSQDYVVRGGSYAQRDCRSARRGKAYNATSQHGFRVILVMRGQ